MAGATIYLLISAALQLGHPSIVVRDVQGPAPIALAALPAAESSSRPQKGGTVVPRFAQAGGPEGQATDFLASITDWLERSAKDFQTLIVKKLAVQPPAEPPREGTAGAAPPAPKASAAAPDAGEDIGARISSLAAKSIAALREWLTGSTRDFQGEIVDRLTVPTPQSIAAEAERAAEAKAAAAEAARKAEAETAARKKLEDDAAAAKAAEAAALAKAVEMQAKAAEARKGEASKKKADEKRVADAAAAKKKADDDAAAARAAVEAVQKKLDEKRAAEEAAKKKAEEAAAKKRAEDDAAAARIAAEAVRKKIEEKRLAEEAQAKKKAEEDAARAVEEAAKRSAEEKRIAEATRKADEIAAAAKREAEAKRKAEEAARADEAKRAAELAGTTAAAGRAALLAGAATRKGDLLVGAPPQPRERAAKPRSTRVAARAAPHPCKSCRRAGRKMQPVASYTVARGDTLWAISARHYRHGSHYKLIHKANARTIRDPNLIFPCQRIVLPRLKR